VGAASRGMRFTLPIKNAPGMACQASFISISISRNAARISAAQAKNPAGHPPSQRGLLMTS
jgi:hypothetical protein